MNRRLLLLFALVLTVAPPAPACMNNYVPNVTVERSRTVLGQLQKDQLIEPWTARRDRLRKELGAGGDFRIKNDLATALAHTGISSEAVTLLREIEAEKPGLYITAANLGTAYELAGNNQKALEWIRRGIERNARAHEGTEWLHVRILEAKLALEKDPSWLESNSVLGPRVKAKKNSLSAVGNRGETLSEDEIKTALIYQLHERLQFVNPPDPIVGDLLFDLGRLVAKEPSGPGGSAEVLALASTYLSGLSNVGTLQSLVARDSRRAASELRARDSGALTTAFWIMVGVAIFLRIYAFALKRLMQRRQEQKRAANGVMTSQRESVSACSGVPAFSEDAGLEIPTAPQGAATCAKAAEHRRTT